VTSNIIHAHHVVLGAGAMGAATAYHLARRGEPVVLMEQFALGHDRGSSHGAARITRHSYADPAYARLMPAAFDAWRQLEADAGRPFFLRTGGVSVSPAGVDYVGQVTANLAELGVAHRRMSGRELNRAVPAFGVAEDADVVFEPDAGMLAAARIVRAEVELARELGGEKTQVLENCPVRRIDLEADKPTLLTDAGRVVTDCLVVTAGPWTAKLVPGFPAPLRPTRQQVLYFRPPEADAASYAPGRLPVFIYKGADDLDAWYGMPAHDGMGVKAARHGGPEVDPDVPDPVVGEEYRGVVRGFLRGFLPALADAPIDRAEVCLYTVAPGESFRVGPLDGRPEVVVASPCSGHGFKFSCLVGRVLADLATRGATDVPIAAWCVDPQPAEPS
jgi:sarcosine oxidase